MIDLGSAELFRDLDRKDLQSLREIAREHTFPAGARIFSENDLGDGLFVIRKGEVEIAHIFGEQRTYVFSKFGPGEIFGEMAVIEDLPRSATSVAVTETTVYFIPRTGMIELLRRSPELSFKLLQEISRRLRDFNQHHLQELIQADRLSALGNFARSIVHDLKTPLTVINMATEIMSSPNAPIEMRRESYNRVRRQVLSINEMVGDILDFTQNARVQTAVPSINYRDFIRSLANEMRIETELKSVRLDLENEPPDINVEFDPHRIRRVIVNLLHNSLDMMPNGGRVILRFKSNGVEIATEVQDTGPGIAPEIADKLFQAFATFGKAHGTGLGLSICKKIVEDHRGRITAQNAPDRGAIFSFTLPISKA